MEQYVSNKSIIQHLYRRVVGQGDLAYADEIIADTYIQHSPMKPGKAGLMEALGFLKQMPKPVNPAKPFMRLIADGNYVATNLSVELGGRKKVVVDLFRLEGGKVLEHWDAMQDEPDSSRNGNPMMNGDAEVDPSDDAEPNKAIVDQYYDVLIHRQIERLPYYVWADMVQHSPEIANGLTGLTEFLQRPADQFSIQKAHRIIGEGNFVVVQAAGIWNQKPAVFYDTFRLDKGKIAEQWTVRQFVPETMPHQNGII
ncbi:nuclear transport factor 2 family protein [Spirosoma sp. SC4-14]|uniref:nuclear transport factor 2 family protein n=1 Tax=Spirosoma sp. SC4-14 TaxID=3128900 RepID=UPI0030D5B999